MSRRNTRRPAVLILVTLIGVLAVAAVSGLLWIRGKAESLERRAAVLESELEDWVRRNGERPPVRGKGIAGEAWEEYRQALSWVAEEKSKKSGVLAKTRHRLDERIRIGTQIPRPPGEIPIMAIRVRAGAKLTHVRIEFPKYSTPLDSVIQGVADSVLWYAAALLDDGHAGEALEHIFDVAWYGADIMRTGYCIDSLRGLTIVHDALRLAAHALLEEPGSRDALIAALEHLQENLPSVEAGILERAAWRARWVLAGDFCRASGMTEWVHNRVRHPVFHLDVHDALDDFDLERRLLGAPWSKVRPAFDAFDRRSGYSDWIGIHKTWRVTKIDRAFRAVVAMIRLLLAACEEGETGRDPFGDGESMLRERREEGQRVLWSLGPDGTDNGGQAARGARGFRTILRMGARVDAGEDIVLVIPSSR